MRSFKLRTAGYKYRLINSTFSKYTASNVSLDVYSSPGTKRFIFKSLDFKEILKVKICSPLIVDRYGKCINMDSTTIFKDNAFLGYLIISDGKFEKNYKNDTVTLSFEKDKENYSLRFVPIDKN
jgi:hypothetical protein